MHRLRGQGAAVEAAGAEPHHLLLAVDDLERQISVRLERQKVIDAEKKGTTINVGGYAYVAKGMQHYAFFPQDTVIQLHGMGPQGITLNSSGLNWYATIGTLDLTR